jgi:hypothetical protein
LAGVTVNVQALQEAWDTLTVKGLQPGMVIVKVEFRLVPPGFAVQLTTIFLFPVPEAGETVHHVWSLETDHAQPVVSAKMSLPALQSKLKLPWKVLVQPACVTVTENVVQPEDEKVRVAVLGLQEVFAVKSADMDVFPDPDAGETLHHT